MITPRRGYGLLLAFVMAACAGLAGRPATAQSARLARMVAEADSLRAHGELEAAEERYRTVLRLDTDHVPAFLGLGHTALAARRWADAGTWSQRVLDDHEPRSLEAHYIRAISHSESARYRTIFQRRQWEGAEKHFEAILRQDSTYRDVLYRYARLRWYHEAFEEAFRLAYAQLRLKPDLEEPLVGLYQMYRHYVHVQRRAARARLAAGRTAYERLFLAELHRLAGELPQADAVLAGLAAAPAPLPPAAVTLARARVRFAQGDDGAGQALVEQAIAEVDGWLAARLLLEDFKYLLEDDEWDDFQRIETAEGYRDFFRAFWARRDPMPSLAANARMAEHYARLRLAERDFAFFGFKSWFNSPDKLNELAFPAAYALNEEFNDRGVVYLRHGEPDERAAAVGGADVMNESWRYRQMELDFHFVIDENASGNNWRLTAHLQRGAMLQSRAMWGRPYLQAAQARSEIELVEAEHRLASFARDNVARGLATESYRWPEATDEVALPFLLAAFRAPGGGTRLEVHYAIPASGLRGGRPADTVRVEAGYALTRPDGEAVAEERRVHRLAPGADAPERSTGRFDLAVRPDSYDVALHVRTLDGPAVLGIGSSEYRAPAFPEGAFGMSDLLPAYRIGPAAAERAFERGEVYVLPNPEGRFTVRAPVFVYFELYDLTRGPGGRTQFTVEIALVPRRARGGLRGLFGRRDRPVLRLRTERDGTTPDSPEHAEIDVSSVPPGRYRLDVTVTDRASGESLTRSRDLQLDP